MKPTKYAVKLRIGSDAEAYLALEVDPLLEELDIARTRLANLEIMDVFQVDADGFIDNTSELAELVESRGPGKWRVSILIEEERSVKETRAELTELERLERWMSK